MGIVIKNMKMPANCWVCPFADIMRFSSKCRVCGFELGIDMNLTDGRSHKCPLSEISAPHGRLIDADKLIQSEKARHELNLSTYISLDCINAMVDQHEHNTVLYALSEDNAPTIFEAEV